MFGVMLAVIFQQSALAIGIGLVYGFVIEGLVFGLFGRNPSLQNIEKAFPGANATALADAFGQATRLQAAAPLVSAGQAVALLAAYILVFLVISTSLTAWRDLI
jgi:hypothetical protein